jgi:diguanylate cyclase (GGDEF)-like protein
LPEMFPGDMVLFLAGVPMLAGLLLRPHLEPSQRSVRLGFLDFLQLLLWWIYLYVFLVLCWQYVSEDAALYNRNYDRLYLAQAAVLLIVLGLLVKQSTGSWRRYYKFFFASLLFNCLTVVMENRAIEDKVYFNGCWYDIPFTASFAYFMVVAMRGRDLTPAPETAKDERYGSWMSSVAVAALLSLPIIVAASVYDRSMPAVICHFRILITALTMFVMAALVLVKQKRLHEELRRTNRFLEEASMTDPLTGIRNRRFFSLMIEADVAQTLRKFSEGHDRTTRDLVFYLIDLDNFKEVNDRYGHDAGDRVLVETARRINSAIRDSDVLLRWGGEEFLVVSRATDRRDADALALRVMQSVRSDPFAVGETYGIRRTCSIGWAAFPWLEDNIAAKGYEEVLNLADRALGQAKRAGKDQAVGMTPLRDGLHGIAGSRKDAEPLPAVPLRRSGLQLTRSI